jgi:hypothetical protein
MQRNVRADSPPFNFPGVRNRARPLVREILKRYRTEFQIICRALMNSIDSTSVVLSISEFLFNQPMQMRRDRRLIESLNDFVQETGDDEALGDGNGNPAGAEIE